jgi:hypothetical protein
MRHVADFWAFCSLVVVLGGALMAFLGGLNRRRLEFLHQKKAFLLEVHQELERNPAIIRAVMMLKSSDIEQRLEQLLAPGMSLLSEVEQGMKNDFDTLFGILNRIAHAVSISRILTREETEVFSWYFRLLQHHPILAQYFYDSGFLDLWDYAQSLAEKDEIEV